MRSVLPNALAIGVSLAALAYLCAGLFPIQQFSAPYLSPIAPEQGTEIMLSPHDGFAFNAVYSGVVPSRIGQNLWHFGSWVQGDASVGVMRTAWFPAKEKFSLLVSGYPNSHDCRVSIEAETRTGAIKQIPLPGDDPMETWQVRDISLPAAEGFTRFRIAASDQSRVAAGWVGFSQPFRFVRTAREIGKQAAQLLLCALTAAAALVALLFPGLWWRRRNAELAFVWLAVPGFFLLATAGLACWLSPPTLSLRTICLCMLGPLFLYALYHCLRFPITTFLSVLERRILLLVLLLITLSVSFAAYSVGPEGELFGGRVSRTLQVGDRSDSRIPFYTLQLIASRSDPHGDLSETLFGQSGFSTRTPLVSLAVAPLVLALPVTVPQIQPDQTWTVFDVEGFAAFRIVMIVLACLSLTVVFGLAQLFVSDDWAFLAFFVTAAAPFVVHETYFTWPKLEASWFVLLAAYLVLRGRFFWAGCLWGVAYLCHPLALLCAPALLGLLWVTRQDAGFSTLLWRTALLAPGVVACVALWYAVNLGHYNQTSFLSYLAMSDGGRDLGATEWLRARWNSLANTLLPFYLLLTRPEHHTINSVYQPSPGIVRFYFSYWNTLPFAVGISYFFFCIRFVASSWRSAARPWLLWVIVPPFLCFTVYWGFGSSGLLREGLQPWVLGILLFSVIQWRRLRATQTSTFTTVCSIALALRSFETLLMLLLPAVVSSHRWFSQQFLFSDVVCLFVMATVSLLLAAAAFNHVRSLSQASSQKQNESSASPLPAAQAGV